MEPTQSHTATPADAAHWRYNERLRITTHDTRHCTTCAAWTQHFLEAVAQGNDSLVAAEAQRDAVVRAPLLSERERLDSTIHELESKALSLRLDAGEARSEAARIQDTLDNVQHDYDDLQLVFDESDRTITRLQSDIARLHSELAQHDRGHTPRRRKVARHSDYSPSQSRTSSRPESPTYEASALHMRVREATTSQSSLPPSGSTSSASASRSPDKRDLLSRIAQPPLSTRQPGALLTHPAAPAFAQTPFYPTVGFLSLLPVVFQGANNALYGADDSVQLLTNGAPDLAAHDRYVLAIGALVNGQPSWVTTLVKKSFWTIRPVLTARNSRLPLPLTSRITGVFQGGRNGILIAAEVDPTTDDALEKLLSNPAKAGHVANFAERIRFTPPELRDPFYVHALERINRQEPRHSRKAKPGLEPPPNATTVAWKGWLKHSREHGAAKNQPFVYPGIPLVENGYQNAHIEGTRAMLAYLPVTGKGATVRGPPRSAFLRAAATLFCVPEQYALTLEQLGIDIAQHKGEPTFDEESYGPLTAANVQSVAQCMALNGVTTVDAESWRAWASAYIEMKLSESPDGPYTAELRAAQASAHTRIDEDPDRWVLRNVHANSPGNYNPRRLAPRSERLTQASSSSSGAGPSLAAAQPSHLGATEEEDIELDYSDEPIILDDDIRMGPA